MTEKIGYMSKRGLLRRPPACVADPHPLEARLQGMNPAIKPTRSGRGIDYLET